MQMSDYYVEHLKLIQYCRSTYLKNNQINEQIESRDSLYEMYINKIHLKYPAVF